MYCHEAVAYWYCSGIFLLWWLHGVCSTPPALSLYLCLDFPSSCALLSPWPKQLYSSTNKSSTYTEGHPTSSLSDSGDFFKDFLSWGWRDGLVVKSIYCSSRGTGFSSQYLHGSSALTAHNEQSNSSFRESDILIWTLGTLHICTQIYI